MPLEGAGVTLNSLLWRQIPGKCVLCRQMHGESAEIWRISPEGLGDARALVYTKILLAFKTPVGMFSENFGVQCVFYTVHTKIFVELPQLVFYKNVKKLCTLIFVSELQTLMHAT